MMSTIHLRNHRQTSDLAASEVCNAAYLLIIIIVYKQPVSSYGHCFVVVLFISVCAVWLDHVLG